MKNGDKNKSVAFIFLFSVEPNIHVTVGGARRFETNCKSDMIYETLLNQWPKFNNPALGAAKETSIQKIRRGKENKKVSASPTT